MRKPPFRGSTLKKLLPKNYGEWHPGRVGQIEVILKENVEVRLSRPDAHVKAKWPSSSSGLGLACRASLHRGMPRILQMHRFLNAHGNRDMAAALVG